MKKLCAIISSVLFLTQTLTAAPTAFAETDRQTSSQPEPQSAHIEEGEPSEYGHIPIQYVDMDGNPVEIDYSPYQNGMSYAVGDLPSSYDLRDHGLVTSVKYQGTTGTCWAHAALGAAESSMLKQNLAGMDTDYSESHLVWFGRAYPAPTDPTDPLYEGDCYDYNNGTIEEKNVGEKAYNAGGNYMRASQALARGNGPMLMRENTPDVTLEKPLSEDLRYVSDARLKNTHILPLSDRDLVKSQLMKTGAMVISYHTDDAYYQNGSYYMDKEYEDSGKALKTNHDVLLVGWDDSYSRNNFKIKPAHDGAWLCKNSWGTYSPSGKLNEGYFYLSYDNKVMGDDVCGFEMEPVSSYDAIYQYDNAPFRYFSDSSARYEGANIFTATDTSTLTEVCFFLGSPNTEYEVLVYTDLKNPESPETGTLQCKLRQTRTTAGYCTVALPDPVVLEAGEDFSVVVSFKTFGARFYVDDGTIESNRSFMRTSYSAWTGYWNRLKNYDVCIKACVKNEVAIDEKLFPDANFRSYVAQNFDINHDGKLTPEESAAVKTISVNNKDIYSLEGISTFQNLTRLYCASNHLETLDVRNLPNLIFLNCSDNALFYLDLSRNTKLTTLYADGNVRNFPISANCREQILSELDVSRVQNLTGAEIRSNRIYPTSSRITYQYDCKNGWKQKFTVQLAQMEHFWAGGAGGMERNAEYHWTRCIYGDGYGEQVPHDFDGPCDPRCETCGYDRSSQIQHSYATEWSSNEYQHWHNCIYCDEKTDVSGHNYTSSCDPECNDCGYIRSDVWHNFNSNWNRDANKHWHTCFNCGTHSDEAAHRYDGHSDTECNDCGYIRTVYHSYDSSTWKTDKNQHWHECTLCSERIDVAEHRYLNACDTICADCGYVRQVSHNFAPAWYTNATHHWLECIDCGNKTYFDLHSYGTTWLRDATGHWYACDVCGSKKDFQEHRYTGSCDPECNDCGYVRTVQHAYDNTTWEKNAVQHWHACTSCGDKTDLASHRYLNACDPDCEDCGYIRTVQHSYATAWSNDGSQHWHVCTICGKKGTAEAHSYKNACDPDCEDCGYVRDITHSYATTWSRDAAQHWHACENCGDRADLAEHRYADAYASVCLDCGYERSVDHVYETEWSSDATQHWHNCMHCDAKSDVEKHVYSNGCDAICDICGYERTVKHTYATELAYNATQHWHECSICGASKMDETDHRYANACDAVCMDCGYVRTVSHSYGTKWVHDGTYHWQECTVCGKKTKASAHDYAESCSATCTVCQYVRTVPHSYGEQRQMDETSHWLECAWCHDIIMREPHVYYNDCDATCNICGYVRTTEHTPSAWQTSRRRHWRDCEVCYARLEEESHVYTNDCDTTCDICGYVRAVSHTYDTTHWEHDADQHWLNCTVCGQEYMRGDHSFTIWRKKDGMRYRYCTICEETQRVSLGDVNKDDRVSITDMVMMQKWLLFGTAGIDKYEADINDDGKINVIDLCMMKRSFRATVIG